MADSVSKHLKSRLRFFNEVSAEFKKITWLSKREVLHLTVMVLVVVIALGIVLGVVDFGFSSLINIFTGS
jgi:preprotein translocase subunit SecE